MSFGPRVYTAIVLMFFASALACMAGRAKAEMKKDFWLFSDNPELAVIRIYGDRILAVPFDRKTKGFNPEFLIRRLEKEDVKLTLHKNIGPLRPAVKAVPPQYRTAP